MFYSKFPDIPTKPGRVTTRRTQAIAKRSAFRTNAITRGVNISQRDGALQITVKLQDNFLIELKLLSFNKNL